jgi:protein-disulfide isomerase
MEFSKLLRPCENKAVLYVGSSYGVDDHVKGQAHAPVAVVEYGDYQCPHCGHAHPIVQRIQRHFGRRLCFVLRNFPLNKIHPNAEDAAEAAEFAGSFKKFWEMHNSFFDNQSMLDDALLMTLAQRLELSQNKLRQALEVETFMPRVRAEFLGGVRSGVNGTPAFFINGHRHDGPFEFEDLAAAIESALKSDL